MVAYSIITFPPYDRNDEVSESSSKTFCLSNVLQVGDPEEVNTIDDFFCKNRKEPLLLGSVKSNMGHAEAAAGMSSLAKVIIAMETGVIPGNLYFQEPNTNIPGLKEGRLKVTYLFPDLYILVVRVL